MHVFCIAEVVVHYVANMELLSLSVAVLQKALSNINQSNCRKSKGQVFSVAYCTAELTNYIGCQMDKIGENCWTTLLKIYQGLEIAI